MDAVDKVFDGKGWIAVYGTGYVGLALIAVYLRKGLKVIGVDIDPVKLEKIRQGAENAIEGKIKHAIRTGIEEDRLLLTTDGVKASADSVVKVVTVPVYLDWITKNVNYDSWTAALEDIGKGLKEGDLVIIESSVPPGSTEYKARPVLEEASGLSAGRDFYLAYSPERVYVGRAVEDIENRYPKIVSGINEKSLELVSKLYEGIAKKGVLRVSRPITAEFEKLAEGVYRDVNIALANELALAAMNLGVDFYEARKAANTQPYSHIHLPGPGVGGYCIPIYPYYLANSLLERKYIMKLTITGRQINENMPLIIANLLEEYRRKIGIPLSSKVAVLGVAFRGNIDDTRLSPTHDILGILKARGYQEIIAHDPYVKNDPILENLHIQLTSKLEEALENAEIILVLTRHSQYKDLTTTHIKKITGRENPLIIDTTTYIKNNDNYKNIITLGKPHNL
ncbi:MAG: nucleotide sugar dehydrogenase [Desulfurococcales archaeon]|nr:nucleotide sugar dehydrogenase [Desulfurococcales archaeon]